MKKLIAGMLMVMGLAQFASASQVDTLTLSTITVKNTLVIASGTVSGLLTAKTVTVTGALTATVTGNADTATALASNPTDCSSNQFATGIAASGNLSCAALAAGEREVRPREEPRAEDAFDVLDLGLDLRRQIAGAGDAPVEILGTALEILGARVELARERLEPGDGSVLGELARQAAGALGLRPVDSGFFEKNDRGR